MSWEDQGRQEHGWFGSGTSANSTQTHTADGGLFGAGGLGQRIQAVIYGAVAALPAELRRHGSAHPDTATLERLTDLMSGWARGAKLDQASFADRFFGRPANDPVAARLRSAAMGARMAKSQSELRDAAIDLAAAQQIVGLDRWRNFIADAQRRADDPATVAAAQKSLAPPDVAKDAIRPVYPVETVIGIAAAGLAGGAAAAARATVGAILRQIMPERSVGEAPASILRSGGQRIGRAGSREGKIRELPGGQKAAIDLFERLTKGGKDVTPPGHTGKLVQTPDGSRIGYRPQSKSGPPTIDVNAPGTDIIKLKFLGD